MINAVTLTPKQKADIEEGQQAAKDYNWEAIGFAESLRFVDQYKEYALYIGSYYLLGFSFGIWDIVCNGWLVVPRKQVAA